MVPILKHQHRRTFATGARPGHDQVLTNGCFRLSGLSALGWHMTAAPSDMPPQTSRWKGAAWKQPLVTG